MVWSRLQALHRPAVPGSGECGWQGYQDAALHVQGTSWAHNTRATGSGLPI